MVSKHSLSDVKTTCLILLRIRECDFSIFGFTKFKDPFVNVKINSLLSVSKICNITCAGVTHIVSYEESNYLGKNSFCDIMLQNVLPGS